MPDHSQNPHSPAKLKALTDSMDARVDEIEAQG